MPQDTLVSEKVDEFQKLTTLFNEEIYVRVDASNVPVTKFKIYDDLLKFYRDSGKLEAIIPILYEHLKDHPDSVSARYILGNIYLVLNKIDEQGHLKILLEQLKQNNKWTIIEYVTDQILQFGEQRLALKFKAEALEKLNKNKELKAVLEKLAKHDRKNPEIAKKYALSILDHDKPKAITYLKQAAESFARSKDYTNLEEIWPILVEHNYEDTAFIEKIERILIGNRERSRVVILLTPIMEMYKILEDIDKTIFYLKKILEYEPLSPKARNDLIRAYKVKYKDHSLLNEFLKLSEIGNTKKPIKTCIANFERNIVFDANNYVLHRIWGVGKIKSIESTSNSIIVDFKNKPNHKLSIQMAISSLKPLGKDHIWVKLYENESEVQRKFQEDISEFMVDLLTSHDNVMSLADIKLELTSKLLKKPEEWTKWWNKAKVALKKDPRIGFNPKKKDEIVFREKPISLAEELIDKFNAQTDINKKIDIALEAIQNYEEVEDAVETFNHYYYEEEESKDFLRKIVAYIYLDFASNYIDPEDLPRHLKEIDIAQIISSLSPDEVVEISKQLSNLEVKKAFVTLIRKHHPNYVPILVRLLFEVPVKANKYVFSYLVQDGCYQEINNFLETVKTKNKDYPEIFLWVAKTYFAGLWNYDWIQLSEDDMVLRVFRLLKPLAKIEEKGTRLKNMANDILFSGNAEVLLRVIEKADEEIVRKLYALYKEVPYISDVEKDKFFELIQSKRNIQWDTYTDEEEDFEDTTLSLPSGTILVTRKGYNVKRDLFDHLVNVEMVQNSRDIGEAQEKGDLRENAEYKAAMERQVYLQNEIKKLEAELKNARVINLDEVDISRVTFGCTVRLKNLDTSEVITYSILGPWDSDTQKNIINYQSPLGKALIGKKVGDITKVSYGENQTNFEVLEIERYKENTEEVEQKF